MSGQDRKPEQPADLARQLQHVPAGRLTVVRHGPAGQEPVLLTHQLSAQTQGKGQVELYPLFPGADASYNRLLAPELTIKHPASPRVLELFYCRSGRVGWNMRGGTAVYLGAGDLTAHSAACCADSAMLFPLGYAEGISISVDLSVLEQNPPDILREARLDLSRVEEVFCSGAPASIPACPELEGIFAPLYTAPVPRRRAYLQLKVQELLLYLMDAPLERQTLTQYGSQQTELIRAIHRQLTEHLDQRFTIEQLSRQYLINTSTLKEVFKAVYGLPIATYMKEYRVSQAKKLLRETELPISQIAGLVGYETQGKFSKAFQDVTQMLPREYRRDHRLPPSAQP